MLLQPEAHAGTADPSLTSPTKTVGGGSGMTAPRYGNSEEFVIGCSALPVGIRGALLHDGVLHRPEGGGGACRYADFVVDVLDVVVGGLCGDEELISDLLRG